MIITIIIFFEKIKRRVRKRYSRLSGSEEESRHVETKSEKSRVNDISYEKVMILGREKPWYQA